MLALQPLPHPNASLRGKFLDMSATSVWVPISSAVAALLGAGLGAMLQGRYGATGWRRQIRLEAYTRFIEATHDFNNYFLDAIEAAEQSDFDDKWQAAKERYARMGRAGSLTSVAGPLSVDLAAQQVVFEARAIMNDGKSREALIKIQKSRKAGVMYSKHDTWIKSAYDFAEIARKVLNTQD